MSRALILDCDGVLADTERDGHLVAFNQTFEELGFGWISIWDHFYAADGTGEPECLEAVSAHAALACHTSRVRCGSLVYSCGYRHPAVLANAIATIDHLSGGRADIGIGRGPRGSPGMGTTPTPGPWSGRAS